MTLYNRHLEAINKNIYGGSKQHKKIEIDAAESCTQITIDLMAQFAEWIDKNTVSYAHVYFYQNKNYHAKELVQIFIEQKQLK